MNVQVRNRLLTYLAGATISVSSSEMGAAQTELAGVPAELLGAIVDEAQGEEWKPKDRLAILSLLAEDRRRQIRVRVLEALDALDEGKRAVFVLYEIEEMSMADVAEAVECPLQTAYSRLHAARRQMRATMEIMSRPDVSSGAASGGRS